MGTHRPRTALMRLWCFLVISFLFPSLVCSFSDIFHFEVEENSAAQTYVGRITTKPGFTYRFNDDPLEFSLDPETGVIVTTDVPTDRESREVYNFVILSSSPTYPLEVIIRVLDVNDNVPFWPTYINTNISYSESAPIGTKVILDNAIDLDAGDIQYQIDYVDDSLSNSVHANANSALPFKLHYNSSTSFLYLEVAYMLDRETQSNYLINISAIDEDNQSSSIIFNVRILDSNDNPPIFDHSDYSVSLNESMGKDVSVLQVRATDADEEENDNSRISYYLNSDDFKIDPSTGVISTGHDGPIQCGTASDKPDEDYWRVCVFTVFAHDYGVPRQDGRTYVTAKIYDSNNHAPSIKFRYFSKSEFASVDENASNGSVVAAVSVVDLDQGPNGQTWLEIVSGNELAHFRLDSIGNSHILKVNAVLDREKVPQYNLTIMAHDRGTPSRSTVASLLIMVQDHNDHGPKFAKEVFETTIMESPSKLGMFVYAIQATDLDDGINSQIFYSISGANSHYFKIDANSGMITTDKLINREEIDYFELRVTARDGGSNPKWAHAILKIKVLDINDEVPSIELLPEYFYNNQTSEYEVQVHEGLFLDLNLIVKDNDLGNNGSVDIEILFDYDGLFKIDHESLKLVSTQKLDFENCSSYRIVLMGKDRAPEEYQLSSLTTIQLEVLDTDDVFPVLHPTKYYSFVPIYAFANFNYSVVINKLQVRDSDILTPVKFEIHSRNEIVKQLFYISNNGEIKFKSNVNFGVLKNVPHQLTFDIDCLGCQPGHNSSQMNIFLIHSDYRSLETARRKYRFVVEENAPAGTIVGQLDVDADQYKLYITQGLSEDEFSLLGSTLKTNQPLDRETRHLYRLQVVAIKTDYFYQLDIEVELLDTNDCDPHFTMPFDLISMEESAAPMFTVRRLDALDADLTLGNQSAIQYRIVHNPFDLFKIDRNELKLARSIGDTIRKSKRVASSVKMLRVIVQAIDSGRARRSPTADPPAFSNLAESPKCHLSNELTLFINLNPTSLQKPHFIKNFYEIFISEATPINELVFKFEVRNLNDDSFTYSIVPAPAVESFGILPSGNLYLRDKLDREKHSIHLLTIELQQTLLGPANVTVTPLDTCQILVHVTDVNDNRPSFGTKSYQFSVPENVSSSFFIGQVTATDSDFGSNSQIVYNIVNSYYSSLVEIDQQTGYMWTTSEYDREMLSYFEVMVQAIDQPIDEDKFTSQVTVRIDILDINDNEPIFEVPSNVTMGERNRAQVSGELVVSEITPVGSILTRFKATDADFESIIIYRLEDQDFSDIALLEPRSGVLSLARELDRETKDHYELVIEASDGKHISRFHLSIIVDDVNDCQPIWLNLTQTEFFIPENISIGSEILTFNAIDYDLGSNAQFHFAIENYSGTQKVFDILNQKLVVINHLDYEKTKVHSLNISLIESSSRHIASTKNIKIHLIDVNDCSPMFIQRSETEVVRILENIDIGTKLMTLQAVDCDQDDILTYEIVSCNTHYHTHKNLYQKDHELQHKHDSNNCPLKLNTRTGEIININNLDREVIESINLKLSVKDSVGHADKMKVIFIIDDINDESPMFVSPKKIVISRELTKANSVIGSVKAIDLDLGVNSAITYKLNSFLYDDYLELDRFTGTFKTKRSLEPLLHREIFINVSAIDGGGLVTTDTMQLIVRPNLPYLDTVVIRIDLYENEPIGTVIANLTCQPVHTCRFHLVNATDRNFEVNSHTGMITTVDFIDREMLDQRLLEVLAISERNLQRIQVNINILDQNDNPPYLTNTSIVVHLPESQPVGSEMFDLSKLIADEDTNNKFDFQIMNCSSCNGIFALNRKTGVLTLQAPLDCEKVNKYRLLFGVSDGIYLLTSLMDIVVDDENDNKPYFNRSSYTFRIKENTERGTIVGQVTALDDDVSSTHLVYRVIASGEQDLTQNVFSLDSRNGQFTLSKRLDYESDPTEYRLQVQASDGQFNSPVVQVVFQLINMPDNPPLFDSAFYKLDIAENQVFPDIFCLNATDGDLSRFNSTHDSDPDNQISNLGYFIDFGVFKFVQNNIQINRLNGCISVIKPFDREEMSSFELTVIASDGYFNATVNLNVRIMDENDNYPVFSKKIPKILKIYENVPIDTIVYTFNAEDADEAPNSYIKYELRSSTGNDSIKLPFVIGAIDGQFKVASGIDREQVDHYDIIVRAVDYGLKHSDFWCRIEIEDVIDNSPVFERDYYEINVFENVSLGQKIFTLQVYDADATDDINYKIISGDSLGHFRVEDDSLVVAMTLDYEQITVFKLKINAIDKAGNIDTTNIKINVLNVLDERPVFTEAPYFFNWFENEIGVIGKFEAYPEDKVPGIGASSVSYGYINYLLLNNYDDSFRLNTSSAALSVAKPIDRESLVLAIGGSSIELRVIAIDTRSRLSAECSVHVQIADANDNQPHFGSQFYQFNLEENHFYDVNATIGFVQALDLDYSDVLQYTLHSQYGDKFAIDLNGRIFFHSSMIFDREEQSNYEMEVYASDYQHVARTKVKITINDQNDCQPRVTKINNIVLNKHNINVNNEFKLKIPMNKLTSILERKFPLVGMQIEDCDSGPNGQVMARFSNDELYSILKIDEKNAIIKSDSKHINIQRENLFQLLNIDFTISDLSELNQLSSKYSIKLDFTNVDSYQERQLVKEDFVELFISEKTEVNETLFKFHSTSSISEINIYAGDVYSYFAIVDDSLVPTKQLDYESIPSFDLYLQAINHQKDYEQYQYIFVRINVENENDNPPSFMDDIYTASILEEEDNVFVTQVFANDLDSVSTKIRYKLVNEEKVPFRIEERTGNIWTVGNIDREANSSFTLTVSAEDEDGLASTCQVHVHIEDKNDNPPRFTRLFRTNITESTPVGSLVLQVTSVDRDLGNNSQVTYSLQTSTNVFRIEPTTGNLYLTAKLDREVQEEYYLTVSANDGSWKPQTTVTIYILDENDNTPQFEMSPYEFNVHLCNESSLLNHSLPIGRVEAQDKDKDLNGLVSYRLKHKSKYFAIDDQTGDIYIKRLPKFYSSLDMLFLNQHFLTVIASDNGLLPQFSQVEVVIRFHPPTIASLEDYDRISITIPADLQNDTLFYTSNSMVKMQEYSKNLVKAHYNQLFFVGESLLEIGQNLSFAIDSNYRKMSLQLKVIESNRHTPVFENTTNLATLKESLYGTHFIQQFKANDLDSSEPNNVVEYSFNITKMHWNPNVESYLAWNYKNKYPNVFKKNLSLTEKIANIPELSLIMNPFTTSVSNGSLYLVHYLDYEVITSYQLSIVAKDGAWYSLNSTLLFTVTVEDVDDFLDTNLLDTNNLYRDSKPDPMSIGVLLVVFFFVILILAIATSFALYHNQKKNMIPQRKMVSSLGPYLSSNGQMSSHSMSSGRFPVQSVPSVPLNTNRPSSQLPGSTNSSLLHQASHLSGVSQFPCHPSPSQSMQVSASGPVRLNSMRKSQYQQQGLKGSEAGQHLSSAVIMAKGEHMAPPGSHLGTNHSVVSTMVDSRVQLPTAPASSIYTQTNSENFTDNYSNILHAEHYDLENASSIAPSDIDIVYHYKGYRNRDLQHHLNQRHAPLSRLSPSVSELSSAPRIVTLQDLSPQGQPIMSRMHKPVARLGLNAADDDMAVTENSYTCSEFDDLSRKGKNMFNRVW